MEQAERWDHPVTARDEEVAEAEWAMGVDHPRHHRLVGVKS